MYDSKRISLKLLMKEQINDKINGMSEQEEAKEDIRDVLSDRTSRFHLEALPLENRPTDEIHVKTVVGQVHDVEHNDGQMIGRFRRLASLVLGSNDDVIASRQLLIGCGRFIHRRIR